MIFTGISRVFSTRNDQQYGTIGVFWNQLSEIYGLENLRGLGYNWTEDTIEYVIGLRQGVIDSANCAVALPDTGWMTVRGETDKLEQIYREIYESGCLAYEIEHFTNDGKCEILYYR